MATMADFGSLLQLGVGIGIGLSLFRAPLDIRSSRLEKGLRDEMTVLKGMSSQKAGESLASASTLYIDFVRARHRLNRLQPLFLVMCVIGGLVNWALLVRGAIYPAKAVELYEETAIVFFSVGYYILIFAALEICAQIHLGEIRKRLDALRNS